MNGNNQLRTFDTDHPGAVVGPHPETQSDSDRADPDATIPLHFRDRSLTIEVPAVGLATADFDLDASRSGE